MSGTLNFGASGTPVLFTVTNGEIVGPASGADITLMAASLNITGVASAAGLTITAIGENAFINCAVPTSLSIPSSVTSIGDSAFADCSGLAGTLTIPSGVTSIGPNAFLGCSGFTGSLTIPSGVTIINEYAFNGCSGFTGTLTIPSGVTSIGANAFNGCSGFTGSLTIPSGVTSIGVLAFANCSGFTGSFAIPNSVTSIDAGAFNGCSGFTGSLTISSGVTSISSDTFLGCSGFTGSLTIPSSVTSIGRGAFNGCSGFTGTLTIPSSVTSIGGSAFSGCSALTSLAISNGTTTIGGNTFGDCYGLTTITIPQSVTSIGSLAFNGINFSAHITFSCNNNSFSGIFERSASLQLFYTSSSLTGWNVAVDGYTATLTGGGGAGDPYVTTFSNINYKLPIIDAPIRYFQTMEGGKLLTVNAQLKTVEREAMSDDTLRSLIVLKKKMSATQYAVIAAKLMKPETLSFFERVSIQHGDQRLVVNLWDSKFDLVENTLRCSAEKVDRADLLKKSGGIYDGYAPDTIKLTIGSTAVYLSTYASPLVRNGIYVESAALKGANGVVVNALSPGAMTLRSLSSVEPVATRDSLKAVTKVETFVDHDGLRTRNVVSYM